MTYSLVLIFGLLIFMWPFRSFTLNTIHRFSYRVNTGKILYKSNYIIEWLILLTHNCFKFPTLTTIFFDRLSHHIKPIICNIRHGQWLYFIFYQSKFKRELLSYLKWHQDIKFSVHSCLFLWKSDVVN